MATLAIAAAQVRHPEWFTAHTWVLPASIAGILACGLLWLAQFAWVQRWLLGIEVAPSPVIGEQSPISPGAASAVGNTQTVNQYFAPLPALAPQREMVDEREVPALLPIMKVRRCWQIVKYEIYPGLWRFDSERLPDSRESILVGFENLVAAKGSQACHANDVEVHLRITHLDGVTAVPHAYWVGHRASRIDIKCGHEEMAVIGCFDGDSFYAFENPYAGEDDYAITEIPLRPLDRVHKMPASHDIRIEVSLVDADANQTLEQKTIRIQMPQRIVSME